MHNNNRSPIITFLLKIKMIHLRDFVFIDRKTWRNMKGRDLQKFVKRQLRVLYNDDPLKLAMKCQKSAINILTSQGKNKRTELLPIKRKTLNREDFDR